MIEVKELSDDEIVELLTRTGYGHLACTRDSEPYVVPIHFAFDEGAIGALHSHPHVQASYVAEGTFEVTIGDSMTVLSQGGSFIVPSNVVHGVKALTAGRLVDCFTPRRDDFL